MSDDSVWGDSPDKSFTVEKGSGMGIKVSYKFGSAAYGNTAAPWVGLDFDTLEKANKLHGLPESAKLSELLTRIAQVSKHAQQAYGGPAPTPGPAVRSIPNGEPLDDRGQPEASKVASPWDQLAA